MSSSAHRTGPKGGESVSSAEPSCDLSVFTLFTKKPVSLPTIISSLLVLSSLNLLIRMSPSEAIDVQPSAYELVNTL